MHTIRVASLHAGASPCSVSLVSAAPETSADAFRRSRRRSSDRVQSSHARTRREREAGPASAIGSLSSPRAGDARLHAPHSVTHAASRVRAVGRTATGTSEMSRPPATASRARRGLELAPVREGMSRTITGWWKSGPGIPRAACVLRGARCEKRIRIFDASPTHVCSTPRGPRTTPLHPRPFALSRFVAGRIVARMDAGEGDGWVTVGTANKGPASTGKPAGREGGRRGGRDGAGHEGRRKGSPRGEGQQAREGGSTPPAGAGAEESAAPRGSGRWRQSASQLAAASSGEGATASPSAGDSAAPQRAPRGNGAESGEAYPGGPG